jgi:hypothetical protein
MQKKQTKSSEVPTARSVLAALGIKQLGVVSYIQVEQDLTVNTCSHGGIGFVNATFGNGAQRTFTVKYSGETRTQSVITYCRATEKVPYGVARPVRDRQCPMDFAKENIPPSTTAVKTPMQPEAIHAILALGHTNGRGDGWRARDLGADGERGVGEKRKTSARFESLLCQDARELKGYLKEKPNRKAGVGSLRRRRCRT